MEVAWGGGDGWETRAQQSQGQSLTVRKSVGVGTERRADTRDFLELKWAENRAEGGVKNGRQFGDCHQVTESSGRGAFGEEIEESSWISESPV